MRCPLRGGSREAAALFPPALSVYLQQGSVVALRAFVYTLLLPTDRVVDPGGRQRERLLLASGNQLAPDKAFGAAVEKRLCKKRKLFSGQGGGSNAGCWLSGAELNPGDSFQHVRAGDLPTDHSVISLLNTEMENPRKENKRTEC